MVPLFFIFAFFFFHIMNYKFNHRKEKLMKKKIFKALIVLVVVVLLLTGCSNPVSGSSRRKNSENILEQWKLVEDNFQSVLKALNDGSEGETELRVIQIDDKGYLKKYEFVGFKDGKQFLVYDENGELKD